MTQTAVKTPMQVFDHDPYLQVTWHDTSTSARGYVVIDQLVTGIATGGLRMRPGCTLDEVAGLAREMTMKMGAFGIHVGGAKGGIDFDSADPRAEEVRERFLTAMRPLLERFWVTAGDLGTQQEQLDQTFARLGIGENSFNAAVVRSGAEAEVCSRIKQAATTRTEGLDLSELVGGFGVAEAALAALEYRQLPAETSSAVIQGFGAMGGSTALYLARAGVKVVGITDAQGLILNTARGLDVELLLSARDKTGLIDRSVLREDDVEHAGDAWLDQDVDLLVPAAVSYTITADNCDRIRGKLVVEAANMPTTPEAEQKLRDRGVTVVPDFIANTGAAAGAWWVILGEVVSPAGACSRLSSQIRPLVQDVMNRSDTSGASVRIAGARFAKESSERLVREYGGAVAFRNLFPDELELADSDGESTAVPTGPSEAQASEMLMGTASADAIAGASGAEAFAGATEAADAFGGASDAPEAVLNHPTSAFPASADVVDTPLATGRQSADSSSTTSPGEFADPATGQH